MSKLDNRAWQIWTALKLFYTASRGDFIIGLGALIVTIAFVVADAPWWFRLLGVAIYAGYNIRNYFIGKNYILNVITGALKLGVAKSTVELMLETPWDYSIELGKLHDAGRIL